MPRRCAFPALALALLLLTGCGTPRLDTTNEETTRTSVNAMTRGMSESEREEFNAAVVTLTAPRLFGEALGSFGTGKSVHLAPVQILKPLDGMTANEIIAKAKATREQIENQQAQKQ